MKVTKLMIDTLVDVIVDYPMCADESEVADLDRALENVKVLEKILHLLIDKLETSRRPANKKNNA